MAERGRPELKFAYTDHFPCKNCEVREVGCHAKCKLYANAKEVTEQRKTEYRQSIEVDIQYAKFIKEKGKRIGKETRH